MTAAVLILGAPGVAAMWLGYYVIDEGGLSRAQEREQRRLWMRHLDKPLRSR